MDFSQIMALRAGKQKNARTSDPTNSRSNAAKRRLQKSKPRPQGQASYRNQSAPKPTPNQSSMTAPSDPIRKLPPDIAALARKYGRA